MQIAVVTLFPEMIRGALSEGVTGRAIEDGRIHLSCVNPRDFANDRHRTVDDRPYGGGPGMVLKYEPLRDAIQSARAESGQNRHTIYLSPQGRRFDHGFACELAEGPGVILVCGRYEGVDERLLENEIDEELSIGDYVLSGGEPAAVVVIDALARFVPGVLGDAESAEQDSFAGGLLDYPHYTRPEHIGGRRVPDVLLSGNHEAVRTWRLQRSLGRTWERRPDLLEQLGLTDEQQRLLDEYIAEKGDEPNTD